MRPGCFGDARTENSESPSPERAEETPRPCAGNASSRFPHGDTTRKRQRQSSATPTTVRNSEGPFTEAKAEEERRRTRSGDIPGKKTSTGTENWPPHSFAYAQLVVREETVRSRVAPYSFEFVCPQHVRVDNFRTFRTTTGRCPWNPEPEPRRCRRRRRRRCRPELLQIESVTITRIFSTSPFDLSWPDKNRARGRCPAEGKAVTDYFKISSEFNPPSALPCPRPRRGMNATMSCAMPEATEMITVRGLFPSAW